MVTYSFTQIVWIDGLQKIETTNYSNVGFKIEHQYMGIKNLNKYLHENCSKQSVKKISMKKLANKTLVIDTSIYLYQFLSEDALLENMYLFISIMLSYNITPIFIFDGKPPPEKRELLKQRYLDKREAYEKYLKLQEELNKQTVDDRNKKMSDLEALKRQCIRVCDEDIYKVKQLMDAYGIVYYDAPGEADDLCAYFVKSGRAWGCVSDDMDMFLYKCPYVIRNLSLMKHTVLLYDTHSILNDLNMNEKIFCEIMMLSGTDYNTSDNTSLFETLRLYKEYNKSKLENEINNKPSFEFYIWLLKTTNYIKDFKQLMNVYRIFQGQRFHEYDTHTYDKTPGSPDFDTINTLMKDDGFIFT